MATNTHAAALQVFGDTATYVPCVTIGDVFETVEAHEADYGVIPIENSTEGVVRETVDSLVDRRLLIAREVELDIHHVLMGQRQVEQDEVQRIVSHPQALAQCRRWLEQNFPHAERVSSSSTSAAAREASLRPDTLAIASPLAAEKYFLEVIARNVSDRVHNATRFVCVSEGDAPATGSDRTSLVFTTPHERGALRSVLAVFDEAGVNMTRIESRPLRDKLWEYSFIVDVEGHRSQEPVKSALSCLEANGNLVKVLGSYPRAGARF